MGAAALPLMAFGTVLNSLGQIKEGQAQAEAARYQARVARNNEIIARQKAEDARERGEIEQRQIAIRTGQEIGSARAALAANNVQVDTGTAANLVEDIRGFGRLDELTAANNAEREAIGFEQQADQFAGDEEVFRESARQSTNQGFLSAATTLVSGGGRVAGKWYDFSRESDTT